MFGNTAIELEDAEDTHAPPLALVESDRRSFERKLSLINKELPFAVNPFLMLPESLWHTEVSWFLISKLDLYPYRPWNVIFLPVDEAGREQSELPLAANFKHDPNIEELVVSINDIREGFDRKGAPSSQATGISMDMVASNYPWLFPEDFSDYDPHQQLARRRVRALAFTKAAMTLDKDVILRSQKTFLANPKEQLIT